MKSINNFIGLALLSGALLTSCSDSFLQRDSLTESSSNTFWQTPDDALMALASCYDALQSNQLYNSDQYSLGPLYMDCISDNGGHFNWSGWMEGYDMAMGIHTPSSSIIGSYWKDCYEVISRCNVLIANIDRVDMDASQKAIYQAEAKTIRALMYINLTMTYQDVPFLTAPLTIDEAECESGGYGDSRINMRGFDSSNLGVLINGVPINGMENGKVYWSNWSGLSDVSQFIQVQRGLGASALGISSVGGTMNMVTKSTEAQKGGSAYFGIGNDGFRKYSVSFSTGLMDNGWAITFMGALNTGDGYVKGTNYEGWTYFGNISKVINDHHKLSLTAFGAPQWHNQRSTMHYIEDYKNSPDGGRFNNGYGYINGEAVGSGYGYNYYHKPQVSLNHYWTIDDKSTLTTSLYGSMATGGGRRARGAMSNWLTIDNNTGRPKDGAMMTPDGLFDYERAMAANAASQNGSQVIFTNAVNDHDWYGMLSSYKNHLTENLTLTGGVDLRYYKGYHTEEIDDLLGGEFYLQTSPLAFQTKNQLLKVGDKFNYYSIGEIFWGGVFAQAEYNTDKWSGFLSASLTEEAYRYDDRGGTDSRYSATGADKLDRVSSLQNFLPWSVKGGFNYKFNDNHNVFVNAGYFTRAPFFNSVFASNTAAPEKDVPYEKITTFELGYGFSTEQVNIALNGYYTQWMDKSLRRKIGQEYANLTGLDAVHMGVELEATYRPVKSFELKGMFSLGDWKWKDDIHFTMYDEANNPIGTYDAYLKDVHVGNSAQLTSALSASWEPFKGFKISADYNFFGKNYADFDPQNRVNEADAGIDSWKLPDYGTIDLGMNYRFNITKDIRAIVYSNVYNLTNTEYIADAKDGTNHDWKTALVYYGFGTTWSAGFKVIF